MTIAKRAPWRIKRIYHEYTLLEEFTCGMWRIITGVARKPLQEQAAALMKAPPAFKAAMLRAVHEWRYSCEHNLTSRATNRIAWLGHAGCCIGTGATEDITRAAWWTLTPAQQDEANRVAAEALEAWETLHISRTQEGSHG